MRIATSGSVSITAVRGGGQESLLCRIVYPHAPKACFAVIFPGKPAFFKCLYYNKDSNRQ